MINAQKLNELLFDEGERWKEEIITLENDEVYLRGNVFIAASSLSYLGPFTGKENHHVCRVAWIDISDGVHDHFSPNAGILATIQCAPQESCSRIPEAPGAVPRRTSLGQSYVWVN